MFTIVEIEQNTPEWLELRRKYVTASQVPIIMGVSPYQSIEGLLEEKLTGKEMDIGDKKDLFQRGHDLENTAKNILSDYNFKPMVIISTIVPTLMASLDGFDIAKNVILEAKYVGRARITAVKQNDIPKSHYAQMQAQLMVSGAKHCLYWCSDGKQIATKIVEPDTQFFDSIKASIEWFNELLKEKRRLCE